jgi:hypothetical protein
LKAHVVRHVSQSISSKASWNIISEVSGELANNISEIVKVAMNKEFRVMNRRDMETEILGPGRQL